MKVLLAAMLLSGMLAGQGQPKNMIPWDKLAEFFKKSIRSV